MIYRAWWSSIPDIHPHPNRPITTTTTSISPDWIFVWPTECGVLQNVCNTRGIHRCSPEINTKQTTLSFQLKTRGTWSTKIWSTKDWGEGGRFLVVEPNKKLSIFTLRRYQRCSAKTLSDRRYFTFSCCSAMLFNRLRQVFSWMHCLSRWFEDEDTVL